MNDLPYEDLLKKVETLEEENRNLKTIHPHMEERLTFLETLLNSIAMPVFYKDIEGVYKDCNKVFANEILGLPVDDVKGKSLFDLPSKIPRELARSYHQKDLELMAKEGTQIYESKVKRSNGTTGDYIFYKSPTYDSFGTLSGIVGVMLDISVRKIMENDLVVSHKRLKTLMEATHVGIVIHDKGIILDVNPGLSAMIGFTSDELIGKQVLSFFPPENHPQIYEALKKKGKTHFHSKCYKKDGSLLPIAISGRKFPYENRYVRVAELINLSERESLIRELNTAIDNIEKLEGLLPICSQCKKIRNESGSWEQIEVYISTHSQAEFTHGLCQACMEEMYGDKKWFNKYKQ